MKEFKELVDILDRLLGPGGCPWDREQTFETLRETILEEATELIDAINHGDRKKILEEAGDLLLNAIFVCKIGEKEEAFSTEEAIATLNEKLIRRHPHVFGDASCKTTEELKELWAAVKKAERAKAKQESALDSVPSALPALARAAKVMKVMKFAGYENSSGAAEQKLDDEEELGRRLLALVAAAQKGGIDAEQALRKTLALKETAFREWERKQ